MVRQIQADPSARLRPGTSLPNGRVAGVGHGAAWSRFRRRVGSIRPPSGRWTCSSSLPLALLVLPLCVLIGALIRLHSPGPAIFKQQRVGRFGMPFTVWKFRTMAMAATARRTASSWSG